MNVELLQEDVKFPLEYDGITYIFDAETNMIAQFVCDHSKRNAEQIVTKLNDFAKYGFHFDNSGFRYQSGEEELIMKDEEPFLRVRGIGRLMYQDRPEERLENIRDFFLEALNVA